MHTVNAVNYLDQKDTSMVRRRGEYWEKGFSQYPLQAILEDKPPAGRGIIAGSDTPLAVSCLDVFLLIR